MLTEFWSELRFRLRAVFRRDAVERELDDELSFHIEHEIDKHVRNGVSRPEALRLARLAFGGVNRIKDDTRDARGIALVESLLRDVQFALRGLRGQPAFTAAVILTLGLGIGVNAAMFGVVDRLLFRPPAFLVAPERVHRVYLGWTQNGKRGGDRAFEFIRYGDLAQGTTSFDVTASFSYRSMAVGSGEDVKELDVAVVSASYFELFSARPVIGRYFLQTPVAFLPTTNYAALLTRGYAQNYDWAGLEMLVRRKPGVSVEAANADLTNAYQQSWNKQRALTPELDAVSVAKPSATIEALQLGRGPAAGEQTRVVKWVSGVAFIVLLIACANVANLLLVRSLRRRREIALRSALGGSRARLFQQLFTETVVLAMGGGIAGLIAAQWGGGALRRFFSAETDSAQVVGDTRTLVFAMIATLGAVLLAGLAPAVQQSGRDVASSLKAGSRESAYTHSRTRSVLLVLQAALSVILLVGAGLFVRSLARVNEIRLGYDVDPVVSVRMTARGVELSPAELIALRTRLVDEARAIPGVALVTPNVSVPFSSSETRRLIVPGVDSVRKLGQFRLQAGSPDYFATVGTRILLGRGISNDDRETAPRVAVVSEAMGRALWPGRDAIGQRFELGSDSTRDIAVVGVAEDVKTRNRTGGAEFHFYLPIAQYGASDPQLLVRVHGRGPELAETIRQRLQRLMPGGSYVTAAPMTEIVGPTTRSWRSLATMFSAFGGLALALAAIGLYSLIAFAVVQRSHELGVRIALGAQVDDVLRLVIGEGLGLALAGIAIGAGVALLASSRLSPLLYQVSPRDPVVYLAVCAILLAVAALASALPAMRAARVDPNVALRAE